LKAKYEKLFKNASNGLSYDRMKKYVEKVHPREGIAEEKSKIITH